MGGENRVGGRGGEGRGVKRRRLGREELEDKGTIRREADMQFGRQMRRKTGSRSK